MKEQIMFEEYRPLTNLIAHAVRQEKRPQQLQQRLLRDAALQAFVMEAQRQALSFQRKEVQVSLASDVPLASLAAVQAALDGIVAEKPWGFNPPTFVVTVA